MPVHDQRDPLENWLSQQVQPLPPPSGTFELIARRARRRKLRKLAVTVVSASAVAAGIAVAVPNLTTALHISAPAESGRAVAGEAAATGGTRASTGTGSRHGQNTSPSSAGTGTALGAAPGGPVPANFQPSSVTFVSPAAGWVLGQAGTPGKCANGYVCTSVVRTDNAGKSWRGMPAPVTGAASGPAGVSAIRFLDGVNGWAFGPELWATHDGGKTWHRISTGGMRVTDLETAGDQAYALFASCSGTSPAGFAADCASYTLESTPAGSDDWAPVGGATSGLTDGGSAASAVLALTGSDGYLVAPDGTLYSGPLGGAWQRAGTAPCQPGGPPQADGLPPEALLALVGPTNLAVACYGGPSATSPPAIYTSGNGGATWTQQPSAAWSGTADRGIITSLAATVNGTLVLATTTGIYVLPAGGSQWLAATATGPGMPKGGLRYVGMTTATQGVAVPADAALHEVLMTSDGGRSWTPSVIEP